MIKVIINSNWAPYAGTDYCEALGIYPSLESAQYDAKEYAEDRWEWSNEEDSGFEDEGPDYCIEEYDPHKHDMYRAGGGSFEEDFSRL